MFIDSHWNGKLFSGKLDGEVESLPVGLIADGNGANPSISTLAVGIEIICEPTEEAISAWQAKTHGLILAANQRRFADYEERVANRDATARLQLQGLSAERKAAIIQSELKRATLAMLTNQNFSTFNANRIDSFGFPYPTLRRPRRLSAYIRFFEQAVEWEHLEYAFFPYFWGSRASWVSKLLNAEADPQFADVPHLRRGPRGSADPAWIPGSIRDVSSIPARSLRPKSCSTSAARSGCRWCPSCGVRGGPRRLRIAGGRAVGVPHRVRPDPRAPRRTAAEVVACAGEWVEQPDADLLNTRAIVTLCSPSTNLRTARAAGRSPTTSGDCATWNAWPSGRTSSRGHSIAGRTRKAAECRRAIPEASRVISPYEAIAELGAARGARPGGPGAGRADLDKMTAERRNAVQREWLLGDSREAALGRALLVRAQPERQDEIFGWERLGVDPDSYWAERIRSAHMEFLLETADFGANEILRIMYLLDDTPGHLQDAALAWRDPDHLQRDANFPASAAAALRASFTNFKYWFDDPFRCDEFTGEAKRDPGGQGPQQARKDGTWPGHDLLVREPSDPVRHGRVPRRPVLAGRDVHLAAQQPQGGAVGPAAAWRHDRRASTSRHARVRVLRWLNERLRLGFAEWNAPGYYVEDIMPLLNLADFRRRQGDPDPRGDGDGSAGVRSRGAHARGCLCGFVRPRLLRAEELRLGTIHPGLRSSCSSANRVISSSPATRRRSSRPRQVTVRPTH